MPLLQRQTYSLSCSVIRHLSRKRIPSTKTAEDSIWAGHPGNPSIQVRMWRGFLRCFASFPMGIRWKSTTMWPWDSGMPAILLAHQLWNSSSSRTIMKRKSFFQVISDNGTSPSSKTRLSSGMPTTCSWNQHTVTGCMVSENPGKNPFMNRS